MNKRVVRTARKPRTRQPRAPIVVSFQCAHCGGPHPTHAHELDSDTRRREAERLERRQFIAAQRDTA